MPERGDCRSCGAEQMTSAPAIPDLLSAENLANPWPGYQILRDHYPVFWHEPSQSWVISRYEHIKPLVKDPRVTHEYLQDILGVFLGDAPVMVAMEGRQHVAAQAGRSVPQRQGARCIRGNDRAAGTGNPGRPTPTVPRPTKW